MKKLPSIGFVYLLSVCIGFGVFISWVAQEGWYDRINTPQETKSDLEDWASYLEDISDDFNDSKNSLEILKESFQIRRRINQPKKALRVLEKAMALNSEDRELKALLLPLYWDSGQKIKAIKLAKENLAAGKRDWGTISVLLKSIAEQTDAALATKLVRVILETNLPEKQMFGDGQIVALGLTGDRWTSDGKPGFLVVSENNVHITLDCYAEPNDMPFTVTINDQYGKNIFSYVFQSQGSVDVELPNIQIGENRLFIIKTDKYWVPENDNRKLGVRITPKNPN